jgi:hypothetical protein
MGTKTGKALIIVLCCAVVACKKDKPAAGIASLPGSDTGNVYVVCEGNYGAGNASLYIYQPNHDSVFGDIYKTANGSPMGDVLESMLRIGDQLFLCVNNSNKILVIDAHTWKLQATIPVSQPRYILQVSPTKAYVSSLYNDSVFILNPETLHITGAIKLPHASAEKMCLYYDHVFCCSWDTASNDIYEINAGTDRIEQAIRVAGYAPQEALLDKEQMLWVLGGDQPAGKTATLTRIDPSTGATLASYTFPASADALKAVMNPTRDTLYFIEDNYYNGTTNNGIYRMDIHATSLPATPFITPGPNTYFWALGIDAANNIYIGDPKGFTQRGTVSIYHPDGILQHTFTVGLGPGHFYFDE